MHRIKTLMTEYGTVAIGVWFAIFFISMAAFMMFGQALASTVKVDTTTSAVGTFGAAYLATKAIQPLRAIATIALTPLVAKLLGQKKKDAPPAPAAPQAPESPK